MNVTMQAYDSVTSSMVLDEEARAEIYLCMATVSVLIILTVILTLLGFNLMKKMASKLTSMVFRFVKFICNPVIWIGVFSVVLMLSLWGFAATTQTNAAFALCIMILVIWGIMYSFLKETPYIKRAASEVGVTLEAGPKIDTKWNPKLVIEGTMNQMSQAYTSSDYKGKVYVLMQPKENSDVWCPVGQAVLWRTEIDEHLGEPKMKKRTDHFISAMHIFRSIVDPTTGAGLSRFKIATPKGAISIDSIELFQDEKDLVLLRVIAASSSLGLKKPVIKPWETTRAAVTLAAMGSAPDVVLTSHGSAESNIHHRKVQEGTWSPYMIQHDCPTNHGWSGAPIYCQGAVVGIHTGCVTEGDRGINVGYKVYDALRTKAKQIDKREASYTTVDNRRLIAEGACGVFQEEGAKIVQEFSEESGYLLNQACQDPSKVAIYTRRTGGSPTDKQVTIQYDGRTATYDYDDLNDSQRKQIDEIEEASGDAYRDSNIGHKTRNKNRKFNHDLDRDEPTVIGRNMRWETWKEAIPKYKKEKADATPMAGKDTPDSTVDSESLMEAIRILGDVDKATVELSNAFRYSTNRMMDARRAYFANQLSETAFIEMANTCDFIGKALSSQKQLNKDITEVFQDVARLGKEDVKTKTAAQRARKKIRAKGTNPEPPADLIRLFQTLVDTSKWALDELEGLPREDPVMVLERAMVEIDGFGNIEKSLKEYFDNHLKQYQDFQKRRPVPGAQTTSPTMKTSQPSQSLPPQQPPVQVIPNPNTLTYPTCHHNLFPESSHVESQVSSQISEVMSGLQELGTHLQYLSQRLSTLESSRMQLHGAPAQMVFNDPKLLDDLKRYFHTQETGYNSPSSPMKRSISQMTDKDLSYPPRTLTKKPAPKKKPSSNSASTASGAAATSSA